MKVIGIGGGVKGLDGGASRVCGTLKDADVTDITEQLQRRNRYRKRLAAELPPEQRLQRMAEMQELAWVLLQQNPEALDRFWRRNLRQRAVRDDASGSL